MITLHFILSLRSISNPFEKICYEDYILSGKGNWKRKLKKVHIRYICGKNVSQMFFSLIVYIKICIFSILHVVYCHFQIYIKLLLYIIISFIRWMIIRGGAKFWNKIWSLGIRCSSFIEYSYFCRWICFFKCTRASKMYSE